MHFRLAIDCTFLLEGEKSGFLKGHKKHLSSLVSTNHAGGYFKKTTSKTPLLKWLFLSDCKGEGLQATPRNRKLWLILIVNLTEFEQEDTSLDMFVRAFPENFNWGEKTHPKYRWHHSFHELGSKRKQKKGESQLSNNSHMTNHFTLGPSARTSWLGAQRNPS